MVIQGVSARYKENNRHELFVKLVADLTHLSLGESSGRLESWSSRGGEGSSRANKRKKSSEFHFY